MLSFLFDGFCPVYLGHSMCGKCTCIDPWNHPNVGLCQSQWSVLPCHREHLHHMSQLPFQVIDIKHRETNSEEKKQWQTRREAVFHFPVKLLKAALLLLDPLHKAISKGLRSEPKQISRDCDAKERKSPQKTSRSMIVQPNSQDLTVPASSVCDRLKVSKRPVLLPPPPAWANESPNTLHGVEPQQHV